MKLHFRFAFPWNYALTGGSWFFSAWNALHKKAYPEAGIRILGFEFWVDAS
jgi:hypothetical protein